jgi:hypothetical protein
MPDLLFHTIEKLNFYAIETSPNRYQAHEFVEGLDDIGRRDFFVAARVLATTTAAGRPPAGRSQRISGSSAALHELRITPRGRRGAHARLLYIRDGHAVRCVRGLLKRERLHRRDIALAERALARLSC